MSLFPLSKGCIYVTREKQLDIQPTGKPHLVRNTPLSPPHSPPPRNETFCMALLLCISRNFQSRHCHHFSVPIRLPTSGLLHMIKILPWSICIQRENSWLGTRGPPLSLNTVVGGQQWKRATTFTCPLGGFLAASGWPLVIQDAGEDGPVVQSCRNFLCSFGAPSIFT